jgi:hypothetical protein
MKYVLLLALSACSHHSGHGVPTTTGEIELDGEWEEPDWDKRAERHVFIGPDGAEARPFSEIRFLRDAEHLYVSVYAADEDIHSSESFDVKLGELAFRVDPRGHLTPPIASIHTAADLDGSLDDSSNSDEEWVVEMAIPIALVRPGPHVAVHVSRCDTPKAGGTRCGAWDGSIEE